MTCGGYSSGEYNLTSPPHPPSEGEKEFSSGKRIQEKREKRKKGEGKRGEKKRKEKGKRKVKKGGKGRKNYIKISFLVFLNIDRLPSPVA